MERVEQVHRLLKVGAYLRQGLQWLYTIYRDEENPLPSREGLVPRLNRYDAGFGLFGNIGWIHVIEVLGWTKGWFQLKSDLVWQLLYGTRCSQ